jgi:tetratricopeptide (TPR) repeat protein
MAQNNQTQCAQIARTLGSKLRTMGVYDESKKYLQQSLSIARSMHLVQYEVSALGELGLLARDRGNTQEARMLLQDAVTRAAGLDAGAAASYEKALRDLGQ